MIDCDKDPGFTLDGIDDITDLIIDLESEISTECR